jgi:hypothetical protein
MHLPHLDPDLVAWSTLLSNIVVTIASIGACIAASLVYLKQLKLELKAAEKDIDKKL